MTSGRFLVTGADGFVGRHVVAWLESSAASVVAVDRDACDVRDGDAVARLVARAAPSAIVHLAGSASVARSFDDPLGAFSTNLLGTVAVLEAVRRHAPLARVVLASSAEVYGAVAPDELPLDEETPTFPASPYASSKMAAETAALQYHRAFGLDVVVARLFNAVGPGQHPRFALPTFAARLDAIARGDAEPIVAVGNLEAVRDFVDACDVARALAMLAERGAAGEIYNVSSGHGTTLGAALDMLLEASGVEARVVVDESRLRPTDAPRLVGSNRKLHLATGWAPEIPLRASLEALYAHYRDAR
jgi:GDP-4-dehydro-6-deoxy-D-mannose reductase